jgi:hypothetical protein
MAARPQVQPSPKAAARNTSPLDGAGLPRVAWDRLVPRRQPTAPAATWPGRSGVVRGFAKFTRTRYASNTCPRLGNRSCPRTPRIIRGRVMGRAGAAIFRSDKLGSAADSTTMHLNRTRIPQTRTVAKLAPEQTIMLDILPDTARRSARRAGIRVTAFKTQSGLVRVTRIGDYP